jgi:hypothetical protein
VVSEHAELAHAVLVKVAEFVRKLPADQLADLASGAVKLQLVDRSARSAPAKRAPTAPKPLPRPAAEIARTMRELGDRTAARRYLDVDLKLTVPMLKQLAGELGFAVRGTRKDQVLDGVVEWGVGRELDADAISRAGGGR